MSKTTPISIRVDDKVLQELRKKKVNVTEIARKALQDAASKVRCSCCGQIIKKSK